MQHRPTNDSVDVQVSRYNGRKFLIKKIALTASTAVKTAIGTTDAVGNTLPSNYTLIIQPVGTDIYYELREAANATAITDVTGARPGFYVQALDCDQTNILPPATELVPVVGVGDAAVDIFPVSSGTALLFWTV